MSIERDTASPLPPADGPGPDGDGPAGGRPIGDRPLGRFLMQVLWPAFLVATVAEGVLFSLIDPHELVVVGLHLADSREATYTVGFFILWTLTSLGCGLTWRPVRGDPARPAQLALTPEDVRLRDKGLVGR